MKQHLDLFTGAGGGLLAAAILGWETVCAVELDAYCRKVLRQRQADGCLDPFPIWPEVRTFDGRDWAGRIDIISAGFPCQPFSLAGRHGGQDDERNLWPETIRVIREVGPRFAFLENVPGLLAHQYFGTILGELAESGFDAEWMVLGADDCGAPHRRKRLWLLASNPHRSRASSGREDSGVGRVQESAASSVARRGGLSDGRAAWPSTRPAERSSHGHSSRWWEVEPDVGRMVDGVASRVDRLRALGNGQVAIVAVRAFLELEGRIA